MVNNSITAITLAKILNVKQLVYYTGLSESWIYKLVQQRKIPHSRPNRKLIFFEREKIDEWLLSNPITPNDTDEIATAYVANNPFKGGTL